MLEYLMTKSYLLLIQGQMKQMFILKTTKYLNKR